MICNERIAIDETPVNINAIDLPKFFLSTFEKNGPAHMKCAVEETAKKF
jgi:hypothetical protein